MDDLRIAYFEGRPHGHPIHTKYANSIGADFYFVDHYLRFHDKNTFRVTRILSYFLTALLFPIKKYDIILSQEAYIPIGLMRLLRKSKKKKFISLMGTFTPYNILQGTYSGFSSWLLKTSINQFDSIICIGSYQKGMISQIVQDNRIKIYEIKNGVSKERIDSLCNIKPKLNGNIHLIFIGDCQNISRMKIKGLDLTMKAFSLIQKSNPEAKLTLVGDINVPELLGEIGFSKEQLNSVNFVGKTENIDIYLSEANFYIHPARGEAWGIAVLEAMLAGLPTIVSNEIGTREIVNKFYPQLVSDLKDEDLASRILQYLNLSIDSRYLASGRCREYVRTTLTEQKSISQFKEVFNIASHD